MKVAVITFLLLPFMQGKSQALDKMFRGSWASTTWTFEFKKNGSFTRMSYGHYGQTEVKGTYTLRSDTIDIVEGYQNTHGTINRKYLLDKDSILIDLYLRYEYLPVTKGKEQITYASRKRNVKYPQIATKDSSQINLMWLLIADILRQPQIKKYIDADTLSGDTIFFQNYFQLNTGNQPLNLSSNKRVAFIEKEKLSETTYIEFEDINMNPNTVDIKLRIQDIDKIVWLMYHKINENWNLGRVDEF